MEQEDDFQIGHNDGKLFTHRQILKTPSHGSFEVVHASYSYIIVHNLHDDVLTCYWKRIIIVRIVLGGPMIERELKVRSKIELIASRKHIR